MRENRKQVLGRGLSALLDSSQDEERQGIQVSSYTLPIELILPGRHQPRVCFSQDELSALSTSIQEKGVLQPILVRVHPEEEGKYEIIAGERRWRAAGKAGLEHIPAFIKELGSVINFTFVKENFPRTDSAILFSKVMYFGEDKISIDVIEKLSKNKFSFKESLISTSN